MIELTHISKVYDGPNRVEALKDISLSVKEGEIFGVIGQSGAGKSTLIRCINMLERPTSGSVVVDGVDLTKLNEKDLREQRKNIGMIFQHFNLLSSRTVYDNVAFPLELQGMSKAEIKERILPILDIVKLGDRLNIIRRSETACRYCPCFGQQSESASLRRSYVRFGSADNQIHSGIA